jgi:hypothetical protein
VLLPAQAGVAQLVEQRICNPQVTGSSPIASSRALRQPVLCVTGDAKPVQRAGVAERSMAADCKSAGGTPTVVRIHPPAPSFCYCGSNSGVESQPSKLLVAGSNPVSRSKASLVLPWAQVAQVVEHVLGKDGVTSSNLVLGSTCGHEGTLQRAQGRTVGGSVGSEPRLWRGRRRIGKHSAELARMKDRVPARDLE